MRYLSKLASVFYALKFTCQTPTGSGIIRRMNEKTNIPNNTEIDKALKEFEAQPVTESYKAVKFYNETDTPKIVQLVMKWSGAKEQKQAEYILLGFVIITIGISLYLFFGGRSKTPPPLPTPFQEGKL